MIHASVPQLTGKHFWTDAEAFFYTFTSENIFVRTDIATLKTSDWYDLKTGGNDRL